MNLYVMWERGFLEYTKNKFDMIDYVICNYVIRKREVYEV